MPFLSIFFKKKNSPPSSTSSSSTSTFSTSSSSSSSSTPSSSIPSSVLSSSTTSTSSSTSTTSISAASSLSSSDRFLDEHKDVATRTVRVITTRESPKTSAGQLVINVGLCANVRDLKRQINTSLELPSDQKMKLDGVFYKRNGKTVFCSLKDNTPIDSVSGTVLRISPSATCKPFSCC